MSNQSSSYDKEVMCNQQGLSQLSKQIIDSAQEGIIVYGPDLRYQLWNPFMEKLTGLNSEDVIGRHPLDVFPFLEDVGVIERLEKVLCGETVSALEFPYEFPKFGKFGWTSDTSFPLLNEEGKIIGILGIVRDITAQKNAERMLQDSLERFSRLSENSLDMIYRMSLPEGIYEYVSPAAEKVFGYSPDEFYHSPLFIKQAIHPDWREYLDLHWKKLIAGDMPQVYEYQIIHKSGETRWVNQRNVLIKDDSGTPIFIEGNVSDITERKQAEARLRESEERFRNIAGMLPEVVFELDLSGNVKFSNRKAYEVFGYSEEDLIQGLNALEMVIPEERHLASERIRQRVAGEVVGSAEYTALRKDGSTFPVILNAVPIIKGLEPVGILGIMTDISEHKSNEMALLTATQASEAANQAKGLFLAKMSHEIRTPLTSIVGYSELLEDAELTPEHKKYLAAIRTSGNSLASLIDDILDLSKVEAGKLAIKPKTFSLHHLITNLVATQKKEIEEKNLSINISIDTGAPDLLIGDSLRIQQVLLNLLRNAIKFTEKGDIDITASVVEEGGLRILLEIAVKDTGVGISDFLQELIFEPFTQVLSSATQNSSGSGLGLTISKSLADLLGGSIRLESQEGVGSTFHFLLPLKKKNGNLSKKPLPERGPSQWSGPVLNILLAEDNPVNSEYIKTVLQNMGHAVTIAENGKVALDNLRANTFDLLLMDIQMPVMKGTDLLRVIREMEQLSEKHLTVIALTAYALIGDKEKYLNMGFDGYLSKPFKTKELFDEMVRVVPS